MRPTRTVGVRELRQRATEIVRQVRVKGVAVQITYRGKVVARLVPVPENLAPSKESPAVWTDLDQLATEIGERWPTNATALDAVRDGRREL